MVILVNVAVKPHRIAGIFTATKGLPTAGMEKDARPPSRRTARLFPFAANGRMNAFRFPFPPTSRRPRSFPFPLRRVPRNIDLLGFMKLVGAARR